MASLKRLVEAFVRQRDWAQFHTAKSLSIAIAVEAAELMDLFKWHTDEKAVQLMSKGVIRAAAEEELADVLILSLAFANRYDLDVTQAVRRKLQRNRKKYPARAYRGRF